MKVNTRVVEIEPGWLLATFKGEKPANNVRAYWLRRSLADWAAANGKEIARAQPVQHGELVGLMAWTQPAKRKAAFKLHPDVKIPSEHLEALLEHALGIYFKQTGNVAIVNRSGVAVLFDGDKGRVLPFAKMKPPPKVQQDYAEWQQSGKSHYFVIRLPER